MLESKHYSPLRTPSESNVILIARVSRAGMLVPVQAKIAI